MCCKGVNLSIYDTLCKRCLYFWRLLIFVANVLLYSVLFVNQCIYQNVKKIVVKLW